MYQCQSDFLNVPNDEWRIDCELTSLASTLAAISPQSKIYFEFWTEQVEGEFQYVHPDSLIRESDYVHSENVRLEYNETSCTEEQKTNAPNKECNEDVVKVSCVEDDRVGAKVIVSRNGAKQDYWKNARDFCSCNQEKIRKTVLSSALRWSNWAVDCRITQILKTAPAPVFVVDENATIQFPGAFPVDCKTLFPGISVCQNRQLRLQNGKDTNRLHKVIRESIRGGRRRALRLADDLEEKEWALIVHPLQSKIEEVSSSGVLASNIRFTPIAAVCVQPCRQELVTAELVRDYYGLTSSESELTAAVVNGQTVTEYASQKKISVATARWHLRNILRGTNSRSQLELVSKTIAMLSNPLY